MKTSQKDRTFGISLLGLTLLLASWIATDILNIGFYVDGFWSALLGGLIVSVVSFALSLFVKED